MALVNMQDMLEHAYRNRYAVGAFDLVGLEFLEAVIRAAEDCRAPVILSLAESHFEHYDFELLLAAVEAAAERAAVPVAIHLDHGASLDSAARAINRGCNGVMVDASMLSLPENISRTRAVADMAHGCGVPVEGELGYVAGAEGEDAERHPGELVYTSVEEARVYVQRTGVDFLAVSVGTVHGRLKGRPRLDFQRLARINDALGVPLVIHGGTGLADEQFRRLIANGVAKINYYTALSDAAAEAVRGNTTDAAGGYATLLRDVRAAVAEEAARCMRLWGSAGRAAEVLMQCRPWRPVEHLIVYNVRGLDEAGRVLAAIPGVRRVFTGEAVKDGAAYRYSWLVRFASRAVIYSYREHPAHKQFADHRFRPYAGERISIDFQENVPAASARINGEAESLRA
jgi:fructose-bisphosphate aldolase class II